MSRRRILVVVLVAAAVVAAIVVPLVVTSSSSHKPTATPSTTTPPTGAVGVTVPSTIASNCSQDVTVALNAWIKSVPNNSTLLFPAGTCYEIEGVIVIANRKNLIFDGESSVNLVASNNLGASRLMPKIVPTFNGAEFLAKTDGKGFKPSSLPSVEPTVPWPQHRSQFDIFQSTNITLENMWIHGSANVNPNGEGQKYKIAGCTAKYVLSPPNVCTYEGQYGVNFRGSSGNLTNDMITDTNSDSVGMSANNGGLAQPVPASNINITGDYIYGSNRDGPSIYDGNHITVANNYVGNMSTYGIPFDSEPVTARWADSYITFTNNTVGTHSFDLVWGHGGSATDNPITVSYNVVLDGSADMSFGQGLSTQGPATIKHPAIRDGLTIIGNQGSGPARTTNGVITVSGFTNVTITGNTMGVTSQSTGLPAILFNLVSNAKVSGNTFTSNGRYNAKTLLGYDNGAGSPYANTNAQCGNMLNSKTVAGACGPA